MTQPEAEPVVADSAANGEPPAEAEPAHCRHCGQPLDMTADEAATAQCPACERYQNTVACPICNQAVDISLMPKDLVPEPHAPARRRRSKED